MDIFLVILVYLIQGVIFGAVTNYLANSKGYDGGFAWGFWLGIIGVMVVGFRPTINQAAETQTYKPMYPNAVSKPKPEWECGCGAMNPDSLSYCLSCRAERNTNKPVPKVKCPRCGAMNKQTNTLCFACNQPLEEIEAPKAEQIPAPIEPSIASSDSYDFVDILEKLAKLHEQGILNSVKYIYLKQG